MRKILLLTISILIASLPKIHLLLLIPEETPLNLPRGLHFNSLHYLLKNQFPFHQEVWLKSYNFHRDKGLKEMKLIMFAKKTSTVILQFIELARNTLLKYEKEDKVYSLLIKKNQIAWKTQNYFSLKKIQSRILF